MYVVIFKAKINALDQVYSVTAARMRRLAIDKYGCAEFTSVTEGDMEIAISYWSDLAQISAWKADAEHLAAQQKGRDDWYQSYQVQVVEIIREYTNP